VLVREGATVLAVDFSGAQNDVATEIGGGAHPFHADVSREEDIEAMIAYALRSFGRVDALLNVAGTLLNIQPEVTVEEYEDMTAVNLRGVLLAPSMGRAPWHPAAAARSSTSRRSVGSTPKSWPVCPTRQQGRRPLGHQGSRRPVRATGGQGQRVGLWVRLANTTERERPRAFNNEDSRLLGGSANTTATGKGQ
jgi:NAD(P)-dependent dehydrogenase (short-subunit alcohol dehydrogenase family)